MADDPFRTKLAGIVPAPKRQDPSAARAHIRSYFDDITAARKRGVAWAQIAGLMEAEGIKAADGSVLTAAELKALYHAEKNSRGVRRKRRPSQAGRRDAMARPEHPPAVEGGPPLGGGAASNPPEASAEADKLRATLARRRSDLREPPPINLGPEDRRPRKEDE